MKYLPIIYVRGYAGTQGEVEETVDDPFYGFNKGATHVRVGESGEASFFAFESPLVRLMTDHNYGDVFEGSSQKVVSSDPDRRLRTIWVYRYYDATSQTFADSKGKRLSIEAAAEGLRDLVASVKDQTGAPRVFLVAHSMGGLVCRSLIQKIYPQHGEQALAHIDKLFTFGSPHGGIHFDVGGGVLEWIRDQIGWNNADDFGPKRMYQYLTPSVGDDAAPPDDFQANSLSGAFPEERVFCVVGTNARDYEVAFGMSKRTVGPQSDGLVQIQHAYVKGCNRAYIHRSHSGRYGMVNSEEGYQNLQRFLFGDIRIKVFLQGIELPQGDGTYYQAEVRTAIRGLPILMHEQAIANYCPITLALENTDNIPLFTFFLIPHYSASDTSTTCRYSIRLAVYSCKKSGGLFSFGDHLEQTPLWSDYLIVDLSHVDNAGQHIYSANYSWLSDQREPTSPLTMSSAGTATVELPERAHVVLGKSAAVSFEACRWD